ncbi:hypothetical protein [Pleionea sediminis]|uniref:hypothetical protein n=1 Tax=Pleionea sediminis TaxID=2569479 RepID=UPI00118577C5|nr:hypothetical protein [Pleionea sediminis]
MIKRIATLLILFSPLVSANDVSGLWTGFFTYSHAENAPVGMFSLVVLRKGNEFNGKIIEPDPEGKASALVADVKGFISGDNLLFTKRYDGTGGRSHEVTYNLSYKGGLMRGFWRIGERLSGGVLLTRQDPENSLKHYQSLFDKMNPKGKSNNTKSKSTKSNADKE